MYREIMLFHHLRHANIAALIGVDRELFPSCLSLVTVWMPYGNILKFIQEHGFELPEIRRLVSPRVYAPRTLSLIHAVVGDSWRRLVSA